MTSTYLHTHSYANLAFTQITHIISNLTVTTFFLFFYFSKNQTPSLNEDHGVIFEVIPKKNFLNMLKRWKETL